MTILKAGSGPAALSSSSFVTTAGYFRSGFATCAALTPAGAQLKVPVPDGDEFWVHYVAYTRWSTNTGQSGSIFIRGLNSLGQDSFYAQGVSNGGNADNYYLRVVNQAGALGVSPASQDLGFTARLIAFDFNVRTEGENAVARCYVNGSLHSVATVAGVSRGLAALMFDRNSTDASAWGISELIVAPKDTRGLSVRTLLLTGNGTHAEMTGDFTDIDDPAGSDGLVLKALSAEQKSSFIKAAITGEFGAGTVIVSALASAADGYDMVAGLRIGGVDYYGDPMGLTTGLLPNESQFLVNPANGLPFTANDINNAEVIVKAIAAV